MRNPFLILGFTLLGVFITWLSHRSFLNVVGLFDKGDDVAILSTRWIYCVASFYVGGFAVVADYLTGSKLSRVTAMGIAALLVHAGFTVWFYNDPYVFYRDPRFPFQFVWMLGSAVLGAVTWLLIRRQFEGALGAQTEKSLSRYSVGSVLVWFALMAIFFGLLTRSGAFPIPLDFEIVIRPKKEVVAGSVLALLLPYVTIALLRSTWFTFAALGVWIISFAGAWVLFCLIGLTQAFYKPEDHYVVQIFSFAYAAFLYLMWLGVMKRALFVSQPRARPSRTLLLRLSGLVFNGVTIFLWLYLGLWMMLNFWTGSESRSADWVDRSPTILNGYRAAYGDEAFERVKAENSPEKLWEWGVHLGRSKFTKEQDVIYRIAGLTEIPLLDSPSYPRLRRELGFSGSDMEPLPRESIANWLSEEIKEDRLLEWEDDPTELLDAFSDLEFEYTDDSLSQALRSYCREKEELFQRIRDIIKGGKVSLLPQSANGYRATYAVKKFATDMLVTETKFALGEGELELALKNIEALANFSVINRQNSVSIAQGKSGSGDAGYLLVRLVEQIEVDDETLRRIQSIVSKLESNPPELADSRSRVFAVDMLNFRQGFLETGRLAYFEEKQLVENFLQQFPTSVDWEVFLETASSDYWQEVDRLDAGIGEMSSEALRELAKPLPFPLLQKFHTQAIDLIATPTWRSRRFARRLAKQQSYEWIIKMMVLHRVRLVGLKLLIHRIKHGSFPDSLSDIDGPTRDPFTGKDLVYIVDGQRFQLRSCGLNQEDDGGGGWNVDDDIRFGWPLGKQGAK